MAKKKEKGFAVGISAPEEEEDEEEEDEEEEEEEEEEPELPKIKIIGEKHAGYQIENIMFVLNQILAGAPVDDNKLKEIEEAEAALLKTSRFMEEELTIVTRENPQIILIERPNSKGNKATANKFNSEKTTAESIVQKGILGNFIKNVEKLSQQVNKSREQLEQALGADMTDRLALLSTNMLDAAEILMESTIAIIKGRKIAFIDLPDRDEKVEAIQNNPDADFKAAINDLDVEREEYIAEQAAKIAKSGDFESILLICGNDHVNEIGGRLESDEIGSEVLARFQAPETTQVERDVANLAGFTFYARGDSYHAAMVAKKAGRMNEEITKGAGEWAIMKTMMDSEKFMSGDDVALVVNQENMLIELLITITEAGFRPPPIQQLQSVASELAEMQTKLKWGKASLFGSVVEDSIHINMVAHETDRERLATASTAGMKIIGRADISASKMTPELILLVKSGHTRNIREPVGYFHGTFPKNLPTILKYGLRPGDFIVGQDQHGQQVILDRATFVATDPFEAFGYASGRYQKTEPPYEPVFARVELSMELTGMWAIIELEHDPEFDSLLFSFTTGWSSGGSAVPLALPPSRIRRIYLNANCKDAYFAAVPELEQHQNLIAWSGSTWEEFFALLMEIHGIDEAQFEQHKRNIVKSFMPRRKYPELPPFTVHVPDEGYSCMVGDFRGTYDAVNEHMEESGHIKEEGFAQHPAAFGKLIWENAEEVPCTEPPHQMVETESKLLLCIKCNKVFLKAKKATGKGEYEIELVETEEAFDELLSYSEEEDARLDEMDWEPEYQEHAPVWGDNMFAQTFEDYAMELNFAKGIKPTDPEWKDTWENEPQDIPRIFALIIRNTKTGEICGFAIHESIGYAAHEDLVYIPPELRREGLFKLTLTAMEETAKGFGYPKLELKVQNPVLREYMKNRGYEEDPDSARMWKKF